ncbi:hypothetical protein ACLOAV_008764 [Pseudogymnoascus australis]
MLAESHNLQSTVHDGTLLSLYIFLTVVVASDSGNHGLLTFKGLNDDSSSLQGNTSEGADVNSLFGTLEKRTPSLFGRQYTCRAGRPLKLIITLGLIAHHQAALAAITLLAMLAKYAALVAAALREANAAVPTMPAPLDPHVAVAMAVPMWVTYAVDLKVSVKQLSSVVQGAMAVLPKLQPAAVQRPIAWQGQHAVPMGKREIGAGDFNPDVVLERAASGAVMGNSTNGIFVDGSVYGNSSDGKVAMIIPLDIPVDFEGSYTVNYTVASGSIKSGFITDDWGEEYGALDISSSAKSSSNTIDIGPDGIGNAMIMAWVDDTEVKLDYTTTSTALTDITTSTPTPTIVPDTTDTEYPSSDPSFTEPPPSIGARQESGLLLVLAAPIAVLLLA